MAALRRSKSSTSLIPVSRDSISRSRQSQHKLSNVEPRTGRHSKSKSSAQRSQSASRYTTEYGSSSASKKLFTTPLAGRYTKSPHSGKKDNRPVTNKKWQSEQYSKVQKFFYNQQDIANNLRSPTVKTFVAAVNILLQGIDSRLSVTMENYKELIPYYLKILQYPASVNQSLMKTPNVPHCWPQIIAILGWLVDLVQLVCGPKMPEENSMRGILLEEAKANYLLWYKQNSTKSVEDFVEIVLDRLKDDSRYSIDKDQIKHLREEVETLDDIYEARAKKEAAILEKLKIKGDELRHKRESLCSNLKQIDHLKIEIENVKELIKIEGEEIEAALAENKRLEEIIANQPCSSKQMQELTEEVQEAKHTINLLMEKREKREELIANSDLDLSVIKQKLEAEIYAKNAILMELNVLGPNLSALQLPVHGFAKPDFKAEIDEMLKKRDYFVNSFHAKEKNVIKKYEDLKQSLKDTTERLGILKTALTKNEQTVLSKTADLLNSVESSISERQSILKKLHDCEIEYDGIHEENLKLEAQLKELNSLLKEAQETDYQDQKDLDECQIKSLETLGNLHNIIITNFQAIQDMKEELKNKVIRVFTQKGELTMKKIEIRDKYLSELGFNDAE